MTKLVYFAWVRERIGRCEDELVLPANVITGADLLNHLKTLGEEFQMALEFPDAIRIAVNMEHVEHDESIVGAREIALFPPMTGG